MCVRVCVQLHCIHKNYKIIYGNLNKRIVSVVVVAAGAFAIVAIAVTRRCYCCCCSLRVQFEWAAQFFRVTL